MQPKTINNTPSNMHIHVNDLLLFRIGTSTPKTDENKPAYSSRADGTADNTSAAPISTIDLPMFLSVFSKISCKTANKTNNDIPTTIIVLIVKPVFTLVIFTLHQSIRVSLHVNI